jgi:hypothetical protein
MSDNDDKQAPAPPPEKPEPRDPTKIQKYGLDPSRENTMNLADKPKARS